MFLADGLSRLSKEEKSETNDMDLKIEHIHFSNNKLEELKEISRRDMEIAAIKDIIVAGWPEKQKDIPSHLKPYWSFRDDSLVLKDHESLSPKR